MPLAGIFFSKLSAEGTSKLQKPKDELQKQKEFGDPSSANRFCLHLCFIEISNGLNKNWTGQQQVMQKGSDCNMF